MGYRITFRATFRKELRRVPGVYRKAIVRKIQHLTEDPRPHGVQKLQGAENYYRIRQGDYRIIYGIYDDVLVVELVKIGHRKDVYRSN